MSTPAIKVYRPITGEEAIEAILMEFRRELVNSGLFPLHRTWHEFEFQGGVRVKGWSTRTEEVKFSVRQEGPHDGEEVDEKVVVRLDPGPPDLLRERLAEANQIAINNTSNILSEPEPSMITERRAELTIVFSCSKCGRESPTPAGKAAHERHCKATMDRSAELVGVEESINVK